MYAGLFIVCSDKEFTREICGEKAIYFNENSTKSLMDALMILKNNLNKKNFPDWKNEIDKYKKQSSKIISLFE